jgi:hypothetical protein
MIAMPLSPSSQWAWHQEGYWVAGTGADYQLFAISEVGDTLRVIEREAEPLPISRPEAAARRRQTEQNMQFRQAGWRWVGPDLPESRAFFRGIRVAADGRIWVQKLVESTPPQQTAGAPAGEQSWTEPLVYDVFDTSGTYLGEVRPPDGFELLASRGEYVWSREMDAAGVPQVVRYRVTFPRLFQ